MPKRILEGATVAERKKQRQALGSLHNLTVQPATRARYDKAVNGFLQFLKHESLALPRSREALDPLVCEYLEFLWSSGAGRAQASDCLAGLQNETPRLRGQLQGSWRLLKAWHMNEVPNRAPPLPVHVLNAMIGWAIFNNHGAFAISLVVGFYGMLRTGEILSLRRNHFTSPQGSTRVVISLGMTKGGKRAGAAESVVLAHDVAVRFTKHWLSRASPTASLSGTPAAWRKLFNDALEALQLTSFGFRPYSLRRGGATWWFTRQGSLDRILIMGRWAAPKTARIYLNEGLSVLAELKIPPLDQRIAPFLAIYNAQQAKPVFQPLEPPPVVGRTGGRGKRSKFSMKSKPKKANKRAMKQKSFK